MASICETGEVVDTLIDGRGVIRTDNKRVFVDSTIAGEKIQFERFKKKRNYDEARLVSILKASSDRTEPKCKYFGKCGGCVFQHVTSDAQILIKQKSVLDTLHRVGQVVPNQVLPPIFFNVWNYRRRTRLAVKYVENKQRVLVGFYEHGGGYITDMQSCEVLHTKIANLLIPLSELIAQLTIKNRIPQVEVSVGDENAACVFRILEELSKDDRDLVIQFGKQHDIQIYLQTGGPETVCAIQTELPQQPLYYVIPDYDLKIGFGPLDFIQTHCEINLELINQVIQLLDVRTSDSVLDLFCGLGNYTLPLAKKCKTVLGIEGSKNLVMRAKHNARVNNILNIEFECADLSDSQSNWSWLRKEWNAIVLDPPRSGARAIIEQLNSDSIKRLVYVSCHPGTLARDANTLVHQRGFEFSNLRVLDMFPHTSHVELIALFTKE